MSLQYLRCTSGLARRKRAHRKNSDFSKDFMLRMHLVALQMCKGKMSLVYKISNFLFTRIKVLSDSYLQSQLSMHAGKKSHPTELLPNLSHYHRLVENGLCFIPHIGIQLKLKSTTKTLAKIIISVSLVRKQRLGNSDWFNRLCLGA